MLLPFLTSLVYVALGLIACFIIKRCNNYFWVRKLLHIYMACWWFLRLCFLESKYLWLGPLGFMIFFLIYERKKSKKGLWQFCFSLTILTMITEYITGYVASATSAVMVMGLSDSLAAIIGRRYQEKHNMKKTWSFVGSAVFFLVTLVILTLVFQEFSKMIWWIIIAVVVAFIEAKILPEYDNITVPLSILFLTKLVA